MEEKRREGGERMRATQMSAETVTVILSPNPSENRSTVASD